MDEKLFNEVKKVLAKQLRKPEDIIKPESKIIDDLGADSPTASITASWRMMGAASSVA